VVIRHQGRVVIARVDGVEAIGCDRCTGMWRVIDGPKRRCVSARVHPEGSDNPTLSEPFQVPSAHARGNSGMNEQPTNDRTIRCPDCGRTLGQWVAEGLILMRHADGSALGTMKALGCTRRCGGVWKACAQPALEGNSSPAVVHRAAKIRRIV
jgi:hypothetical protein